MKKLLSCILAIAVIISTFSTTILASDITTEIITKPKKYIEPCFGDYEIIPNDVDMLASNPDIHESNNSFSYATYRSTTVSGNKSKLQAIVYGTIHRETWLFGLIEREVDEDYYRFETYGDAIVQIVLDDIPVHCDYEMEVWKFRNEIDVTADDIEKISESTEVGVNPERVTLYLEPGTYFVRIYSYNETYNDSESYCLSITGDYQFENVSISDLQDAGAKAAIWVTDYKPCGVIPYNLASKVRVGYEGYPRQVYENCFANPYFNNFMTGNPIEHYSLYVWGKETRETLWNKLEMFINEIDSKIDEDEDKLFKLNIASTVLDIGYEVAMGFLDVSTGASIAVSYLIGTPGSILQACFPVDEWIATKKDVIDYLRILQAAVETSQYTDDRETVKITVSYIFSETYTPHGQLTQYYLDYTPRAFSTRYKYTDDLIYGVSEGSFAYGTISGIYDDDDFRFALY